MDATRPHCTRPIRVVTLVDYLTLAGGAERLALSIATRLDRDRFESILCASRFPLRPTEALRDSDKRALRELRESNVRLLGLKRRRKLALLPWVRLGRFLHKERVDILHTHKFGSNVWGTPVGRIARVPVVLAHEHTWSYDGQPLRSTLDRKVVARCASRFIAVSRADQRRMIEIERIDPAKTVFIPNGVLPLPPPSGRDVRGELGIDPDVPVIGVVGMLRPQKAHRVVLHAVALLRKRWPTVRLLIVGSGPELATLERAAQDFGVHEKVRFLGDRTDVSDLLAALDVAVCCSDFEGSPLSVMEYMDAALPIAATNVGGVPDLIEQGVHGLLVQPQDPAGLAQAISTLLQDPDAAQAMGMRARERRRAEFDIDVQIRRLEALYIELLETQGRGARRELFAH